MIKPALQDIQKTLSIIRNQIDAVDARTKWPALELLLASSASVVALAKYMAQEDTKAATPKILITKPKGIDLPGQQASEAVTKDAAQTAIKPITIKKPSPNKQIN